MVTYRTLVAVLSVPGMAGSVAAPAWSSRMQALRPPGGLAVHQLGFSRTGRFLIAQAWDRGAGRPAILAWSRARSRWLRLPAAVNIAFPAHDRWWILIRSREPGTDVVSFDVASSRTRLVASLGYCPDTLAVSPDGAWVVVAPNWSVAPSGGDPPIGGSAVAAAALRRRICLWRVGDGARRYLTGWSRDLATQGWRPEERADVLGWSRDGGLAVRLTLLGTGPRQMEAQIRIDAARDRLIGTPSSEMADHAVTNSLGGCVYSDNHYLHPSGGRLLYRARMSAPPRTAFTWSGSLTAGHDEDVGYELANAREVLLAWGAKPLTGRQWRVCVWSVPLSSCRAQLVYERTIRMPRANASLDLPPNDQPTVLAAVSPLADVAAVAHTPDRGVVYIVAIR